MNVQVLGSPVISKVYEALKIILGNSAEDSEKEGRANTLDNDDCKDDNES